MSLVKSKVVEGVGVVIASTNRPEIIEQTLLSLVSRRTLPEVVVLSLVCEKDAPTNKHDFQIPIQIIYSKSLELIGKQKGLPLQRNNGVNALPRSISKVVFLDDDMEIHDECIQEVKDIFLRNPNLAAFSGCVIKNGGLSRSESREILDSHKIPNGMPDYGLLRNEWPGLYGCCMCVRRELVEKEPFDQNLPLYAIGEDTEIGFRLRKFGKVGGVCPLPGYSFGMRFR